MFEFLIFTKQGLFPFVNVSFTTVSEVLFFAPFLKHAVTLDHAAARK